MYVAHFSCEHMSLLWSRAKGSQGSLLPSSPSLFPISFGLKHASTLLARAHDMTTAKRLSASTRNDAPGSLIAPTTLLSRFSTSALNAADKAFAASGFAATRRSFGFVIFVMISTTQFSKPFEESSPYTSSCLFMNCVWRSNDAIPAHRDTRASSSSAAAASSSAAAAVAASSSAAAAAAASSSSNKIVLASGPGDAATGAPLAPLVSDSPPAASATPGVASVVASVRKDFALSSSGEAPLGPKTSRVLMLDPLGPDVRGGVFSLSLMMLKRCFADVCRRGSRKGED